MRKYVIAAMLLSSTSAFAQTVDQQGAGNLTANLQRYVGQQAFEKNILGVSVDGDAYALTFDIGALMALAPPAPDDVISFEPKQFVARLKPLPDGRWDISYAFSTMASAKSKAAGDPPGTQEVKWSASDIKLQGIFDPAIAYLSEAVGSYGPLTFQSELSSEGETALTDVSFAGGTFNLTGKAGANGGVDFTSRHEINEFVETISSKGGEVSIDPITIRSPRLEIASSGAGVRSAAMLDLLTLAVANADKEKIVAAQAELKAKLLAALPLWESVNSAYTFNNLDVVSPQGNFRAAKAGVNIAMQGITTSSSLSYGFSVTDPVYPQGLIPAWAEALVPTEVTMHLGGTNLNFEEPARIFIQEMDIATDPPVSDLVSARITAAFMATKPMFTLRDTLIRNKDTAFTMSGDFTYPELAAGYTNVDGTMTIEASGIDKLEEALKTAAASDPTAAQAFPAVLAIKGFAKTLPDGKLQWVIDVDPDGSVKVNGTTLKGPDAPEPPALEPDGSAPGITNPDL